VIDDITSQLGLVDPDVFVGSVFRPNLRIALEAKDDQRTADAAVLARVASFGDAAGIVYCLTRDGADGFAGLLRRNGVPARAYHAGLSAAERAEVQDAFLRGDTRVIAATIAFGMGVDKPDVRFVLHRGLSASVEAYYQEIGRAGRDGEPSSCVMLWSWEDVLRHDALAADGDPAVKARAASAVRRMYRYAAIGVCRHAAIAAHFGESLSACREACDICAGREVADTPEQVEQALVRDSRRPRSRPPECPAFRQLASVRVQLARRDKVPAFVVFTDDTLRRIVERRPSCEEELLRVKGVGRVRVERYGTDILEAVRLLD
jgi:ATP-dependent DNA helicase RecQ